MRRPLMLGALGVALALVAAGCVGFSVTKEVTGSGEPDGPFTVLIECESGASDSIEFEGSAADYPQTDENVLIELDAEGDASCLVTEPETANATTTTIECGVVPPSVTCTDTPDGLLVEVDAEPPSPPENPEGPFVIVNLIVTNDIPPETTTTAPTTTTTIDPNALNAIVTSPNFTG